MTGRSGAAGRVARRGASGADAAASGAGDPLVLALPKGRIARAAADLLGAAGYDISAVFDDSRRLMYDCGSLRVTVVRASDVPTYVAHGAVDVGVAGKDVLEEQALDLYEPVDLGIGPCRMVVAEPADRPADARSHGHLRIATKYPRIARKYLQDNGITAEIIKLSGSIELAPLIGLADRVVDLTETGETLRQNGLVEVETVCHITSRLVVSPASLKLRAAAITALIDRLRAQVEPGRRPVSGSRVRSRKS